MKLACSDCHREFAVLPAQTAAGKKVFCSHCGSLYGRTGQETSAADEPCGVIRIVRHQRQFGRVRKLNVLIDGKRVGYVNLNEAFDFIVDPGAHTVQVKMDWLQSLPVKVLIEDKQRVVLWVNVPSGTFNQLVRSMFRPSRFFKLWDDERSPADQVSTLDNWVIGLGVCLVLFYLLVYDTTVQVPGSSPTDRVYNIGRMNNRLVGVIVGLGSLALGMTLKIISYRPYRR